MDKQVLIFAIRILAFAWLLNGIGHWLIIFGVFKEDKAPAFVNLFFRSCAMWTFMIAYGLWNLKGWGWRLGIVVAVLHLCAHAGLLLRQIIRSKPLEKWRFLEVAQVSFYIIFSNLRIVKDMFH